MHWTLPYMDLQPLPPPSPHQTWDLTVQGPGPGPRPLLVISGGQDFILVHLKTSHADIWWILVGKQGLRTLLECFVVSGWCLCSSGEFPSYWNVFLFQGGVCVQAGGYASYWNAFLFEGGVCVQAGGTHPTGMLSCLRVVFVLKWGVHVLLECFLV